MGRRKQARVVGRKSEVVSCRVCGPAAVNWTGKHLNLEPPTTDWSAVTSEGGDEQLARRRRRKWDWTGRRVSLDCGPSSASATTCLQRRASWLFYFSLALTRPTTGAGRALELHNADDAGGSRGSSRAAECPPSRLRSSNARPRDRPALVRSSVVLACLRRHRKLGATLNFVVHICSWTGAGGGAGDGACSSRHPDRLDRCSVQRMRNARMPAFCICFARRASARRELADGDVFVSCRLGR